jgi:hypothetical protein
MKSTAKLHYIPSVFMILAVVLLNGCNMPGRKVEITGMDVTQAYQTVQAHLTRAVDQTPVETESQTPAPPDGESVTQAPDTSPTTGVENPNSTQTGGDRCDQAAAAYPQIDISIPDDTSMTPGESFTKIWRVVNVGTCTWTPQYQIIFFSGEAMDAPQSLPLNTTVSPNQSVDLSVDMVAPADAGTYQGNWKLKSQDGALFGIGPNGESPFWVRIQVVPVATQTPTGTPTLTPTTAVQSSGAVTLVVSDTLDLDNLMVNASGDDLVFNRTETESPQYQLAPTGSVLVVLFGGTQPALNDCEGASLDAQAITLDDLDIGSYVCYQTDLGLPGWFRLDEFDPEAGSVVLQILTWKLP